MPVKISAYGEPRLTVGDNSAQRNLVDDMSQTSALIVFYGILALIPAILDLIGVSGENVDWNGGPDVFPPVVNLIGAIIRVLFGLISIFVGFQYTVSRWGNKFFSMLGLGITLLAWFPFLATISQIGFHADKGLTGGPPLAISPEVYAPTESEINAIAIMGCIGFYGYAGTVIGALTFLHWKSWKFHSGDAVVYNANYYLGRQGYYGFLFVMAGCTQVALGAYIMDHFGDGKLPAPIACGPWFVLWPELSVFVGVLQIFFGAYVIVRSTVQTASPGTDEGLGLFQAVGWFVMIASVMCQSVGQVSLHAVNAPGVFVVNIIGFSLWPMYLDVMGHTTPASITDDMFTTTKAGMIA